MLIFVVRFDKTRTTPTKKASEHKKWTIAPITTIVLNQIKAPSRRSIHNIHERNNNIKENTPYMGAKSYQTPTIATGQSIPATL